MAMDYAQQQRNPGKHLTGITAVVVLHIVVGYALVNGLARKVIDVVKGPLETKIIEEVKKPPPPDTPPPPPPKLVQPLQTFVPPPEVQIQQPVVQAPVIQAVQRTEAPVFQRPAAPAPVAAPSNSVGVACPNSQKIRTEIQYPVQARREGLQGDVTIRFTVTATGQIKDPQVVSSSNRVFNNVSLNAIRQFNCVGQGQDVVVEVPFSFKLTD
jgi:protein TonB